MNIQKRRLLISAGLAVLLVVFALYLNRTGSEAIPQPDPYASQTGLIGKEIVPVPAGNELKKEIGFASQGKLIQHYRKHGSEFGSITMEEYLRRAQTLRDRPKRDDILEHTRTNGVVSRFDTKTGDFVAFNRDGTLRTFFRPNDGVAYFHRQAQRDTE